MGIFLLAIGLCMISAGSALGGIVLAFKKQHKVEWILGLIVALSSIISFVMYYYLRITLSGGLFTNPIIIGISLVYAFAVLLGLALTVHGRIQATKNLPKDA